MKLNHAAKWITVSLWGLTIAGCTAQKEPELLLTAPNEDQQLEIIRLQQIVADKEQEINHLKNLYKYQELEINSLKANQQSQVKELKETSSQAARAEVKLRRFATEADVASRLAEVEVAMEVLQSSINSEYALPLLPLAQSLLDKATVDFKRNEYSTAADHAAQAQQLIDMLMDAQAVAGLRETPEIPFKVIIPLKMKVDSQLHRTPHNNAVVIGKLQKTTPVVAHSYQEQWLHVQTENGNTGWIFADYVEPR